MAATLSQIRREAKRIFRWCMVNGNLDEHRVRQAALTIIGSRRRGYVALFGQFQKLLKVERARRTANVESALKLSPELQARVQDGLETAYGGGVITAFALNPDLIGGMRIQIGSDVYDGSVRARLAALERSFGIEPIRQLRAS